MKLKFSTLAILAACGSLPLVASASGLSRSSQSTDILFKQGRLFEFGMTHISPDLPGKYQPGAVMLGAATGNPGNTPNSDAPKAYNKTGFAVKADINDSMRFAFIYDQPWGVSYGYSQGYYKGWGADVYSHNLTALLAAEIAPNITIYGGPAVENNVADITLAVRSPASDELKNAIPTAQLQQTDYHTHFGDTSWGYVVGGAYEIPAIALRVALTYRSDIEHKQDADETLTTTAFISGTSTVLPTNTSSKSFSYKSPKSVNLEFQTGVTQSTLLMASIRWTDHSKFLVYPVAWKAATKGIAPLASYEKPSLEYNLGVGQKINDMFSIAAGVSFDSGTGGDSNDASPFGPYEGSTAFTLGGVANLTDNISLTLGGAYSQLKGVGTGKGALGKFDNGSAIAYAGKISVKF